MKRTGLVWDPVFLEHVTDEGHPEHPRRFGPLYRRLQEPDLLNRVVVIDSPAASDREILLVHSPAYLDKVKATAGQQALALSADTLTCDRSYDVALRAVGGLLEACRAVLTGTVDQALVIARPPGHHAERHRAMGFCIFNNVAIAASALRVAMGVSRVLIVDWDLHHGNGTQHVFERDPSVFFFSTHQFPHYPGTGGFTEIGLGPGEGATMNVPMAKGCGDSEFLALYRRLLSPVCRAFDPELILVSAGIDIHRDDPLGSMNVTPAGFAGLTRLIADLADEVCGGRAVYCLEGGYNGDALADAVLAMIDTLTGRTVPDIEALVLQANSGKLDPIVQRCVQTHPGLFRNPGANPDSRSRSTAAWKKR